MFEILDYLFLSCLAQRPDTHYLSFSVLSRVSPKSAMNPPITPVVEALSNR